MLFVICWEVRVGEKGKWEFWREERFYFVDIKCYIFVELKVWFRIVDCFRFVLFM